MANIFNFSTKNCSNCYENKLHEYVRNNNIEIIFFILKTEVLSKDFINKKDCDGNTALHIAVEKEFFNIADLLIEFGADVKIPNAKGQIVEYYEKEEENTIDYYIDTKNNKVIEVFNN